MKFASMLLGAAAARRSFDLLNLETDAEKTLRETGEKTKAALAFTTEAAAAGQAVCGTQEACDKACAALKMSVGTTTVKYVTLTGAEEGTTECTTDAKKCKEATTDVLFCAKDETCDAGKLGDAVVSCGGGSGLVIGLVVAGVVLVGGGLGFYCYKKNSAASEGGHKESLFVKM